MPPGANATSDLLHVNSTRPTIGHGLNLLSGLDLRGLGEPMLCRHALEQDQPASGKAEQHDLVTDAFAIFHEFYSLIIDFQRTPTSAPELVWGRACFSLPIGQRLCDRRNCGTAPSRLCKPGQNSVFLRVESSAK
jgi:hypothetical protein